MKILLVLVLICLLSGCYTSSTPVRSDYYEYNGWYGWWNYSMGYGWYPYHYHMLTPEVVYPPRWRMPHPAYNAPRHEDQRPVPPVRHETFRPPAHSPPPQNPETQPARQSTHPPRKKGK